MTLSPATRFWLCVRPFPRKALESFAPKPWRRAAVGGVVRRRWKSGIVSEWWFSQRERCSVL
mgnify:CR=1 FL=1